MIDPTDPAVLDVHDFRQAGASKRLSRTVHLVDPPANPVIGVPNDAGIELDLLLESVVEGVLVSGDARYPLVGQCSRCLEPLAESGEVAFSDLYLWEPPEFVDEEEPPLLVIDGLIDVGPQLRDAIGLELPLAPLCAEDCLGLCPQCGVRLVDAGDHHHESLDPRWAALSGWESDTDDEVQEGMRDTGQS